MTLPTPARTASANGLWDPRLLVTSGPKQHFGSSLLLSASAARGPEDSPQIELMHSLIIDVAADPTSEVLLLIQDVMFHARNDTRALCPFNRMRNSNASQVGVRAKGFEVAATSRIAAQRANYRAELDICMHAAISHGSNISSTKSGDCPPGMHKKGEVVIVYVPIPFSLNSAPNASPRLRISDLDHVAAALMPAGNAEFRSATQGFYISRARITRLLLGDILRPLFRFFCDLNLSLTR